MAEWNFFTNYGHVIFILSSCPRMPLRKVALEVGITERATQKIISDLEKDGFIEIKKEGRNNCYKVIGRKRLRHAIEKSCRIKDLTQLIDYQHKDD